MLIIQDVYSVSEKTCWINYLVCIYKIMLMLTSSHFAICFSPTSCSTGLAETSPRTTETTDCPTTMSKYRPPSPPCKARLRLLRHNRLLLPGGSYRTPCPDYPVGPIPWSSCPRKAATGSMAPTTSAIGTIADSPSCRRARGGLKSRLMILQSVTGGFLLAGWVYIFIWKILRQLNHF